ncbi:CDP-diacylglycerol--serine O-phosphatidyltransferase [Sedimentimonas flavescens]|uniref:CDP-diacylglycerol--serine O-phosphatidyltransferase n=1 Tax=Sedimentimonas flavescens TaxID=2851012 RepID=A0ABT2ZX08_9RHOB|nr:CDP-diacylglycerol--serine O-phosphatidyltransferase [Sedimentimonas flavescens]MBW0159700.1 CDP-diacylglycerol--serine O-phosphatidyltransferase [Sedimentimonas flavescens]MCT2540258.1 CDP-diacylglycerol--serine O-phosphatidyltransferase [Sedimentimonas flavescens]MCV2878287.1 CDP-diacylglycerol--serine O-phosphatidyltransferase [Sedimentimonas flavescens]WBL34034.1 CDP-diacylglycerol--serine O-phosphatidyltransferase [Sinirhodobacter sp. HNIBRBA609]
MEPREREQMPFLLLLPNLVTIAGMCLGLTSIRFTMVGKFETAVVLLILAALIDGLDGLIARRLRATSDFGAELDSLSDFLCFGVAPGLLVYRFALGEANALGWVFVLIFAAAGCLRLARFNVTRGEAGAGKSHFTGVPAPAGAMLALLPVFLSLAGMVETREAPFAAALWLGLVGFLMISRVPTFSPKSLRVPRWGVGVLLMGTAIAMGLMFTRIWLLMALLDLIYVAMLVPGVWRMRGRILR